jgi:hypothetical protein
MPKYVRMVIKRSGQIIDMPIQDGNSFANCIMQMRIQGFAMDTRINAYVPIESVELAMEIDLDVGTSGMTKQ